LCPSLPIIQLKEKLYKTMIRPVMIYGEEAWAVGSDEKRGRLLGENRNENAAVDSLRESR
jgi:hypothetical protein